MIHSKQFIEQHLLRKQEVMEWVEEEEDSDFVGYVVRRTPRTYRRLARLYAAKKVDHSSSKPTKTLLDLRLSMNKMKEIAVDMETIEDWFRQGWIIRKVELSDDGRTSKGQGYVMGPMLFDYLENEKQQKIQQQEELFKNYQSQLATCRIPKEGSILIEYIDHLLSIDYTLLKESPYFRNWPISKRMRFIAFVIAVLSLRAQKDTFDFKEIGAAYFKKIGGSKVFDRQQDDFIDLLEAWLGKSVQVLGLVSHGHITSVYFSGSVKGNYAHYNYGSLHAVTDVALLNDHFTTQAQVVWLVENRAILTRMAASSDFLKETKSLVICVDGHIRSAHRQFIEQIITSPSINQIIIWTDYDDSGLSIAHAAYEIVDNTAVKFIARDGRIFTNYPEYSDWLQAQLKLTKREQEEVLGDENLWERWINH